MTPRMRDAQTKMYGKRGLNKQVVDDHDHDDDIFALYSLWVVHNKTFYIFFFCFARFGRRSCLLLLLLLLLFSFFFHLVLNLKYICDYAYSLLPAMTHDRFKCFKRSKETVARIDTYARTQPSREFTQFTFHFKYDDTLNADMLTAPQQRKRIRYVCGYFMQTLARTHTRTDAVASRTWTQSSFSYLKFFFVDTNFNGHEDDVKLLTKCWPGWISGETSAVISEEKNQSSNRINRLIMWLVVSTSDDRLIAGRFDRSREASIGAIRNHCVHFTRNVVSLSVVFFRLFRLFTEFGW